MSKDISHILEGWDFLPGQPVVRKIETEDGTTKLQLRMDLGLLQMEETGRPDGKRPFGHETMLAHVEKLLRTYVEVEGSESGFQMTDDDCNRLQIESMQFYHRRISWLALAEYAGAEADAIHNLRIIELVDAHAPSDHWRDAFVQWRPFVLLHRTVARARQAWAKQAYDDAMKLIDEGINEITEVYRARGREEDSESGNEIAYLKKWAEEIEETRPLSLEERLERELNQAVELEEFERAAGLRDRLTRLRNEGLWS